MCSPSKFRRFAVAGFFLLVLSSGAWCQSQSDGLSPETSSALDQLMPTLSPEQAALLILIFTDYRDKLNQFSIDSENERQARKKQAADSFWSGVEVGGMTALALAGVIAVLAVRK